MIPNRRGFLRLLGIGAASAPVSALAAKQALTQNIASLTAVGGRTMSLSAGINRAGEPPTAGSSQAVQGLNSWVHPHIRMADYIRVFGRVPEHVDADMRERARNIFFLDPDIANKHSWSLSVKILTQQQRQYERELERYKRQGWHEKAQEQFSKLFGFRWSW